VLLIHHFFIPSVISVEGDIAGEGYKEDHRTKHKKTTIKEKLGAFLVTRDPLPKGKTDKEKQKGDANGKKESAPSLGEMKNSGYIMLALDVQEEVPCHSCGYPTMTALAPESFTKFDRKYTCSTSCFRTLQHYKSAETKILQTKTVKRVADSLRASTAYSVKALRLTNAEEVRGGGDSFSNSMDAAMENQVHVINMLQMSLSYNWNASHGVADGLNRRLYDAKTYSGLSNGTHAMGQLQPTLIGKKGKEWCTALTSRTKKSKRNVDLDVTKHVEWETISTQIKTPTISAQIKTPWALPMGPPPITEKKGKEMELNQTAGLIHNSERHTPDMEVQKLRKDSLALKSERDDFLNQANIERKKVEDMTKELNEMRLKLEAESDRAGRAETKFSELLKRNRGIAATLIQTEYRRYVGYENFQLMLYRIITLQQLARVKEARKRLKELRLKKMEDSNIHHQQDTTPMEQRVDHVDSANIRTDAENDNDHDGTPMGKRVANVASAAIRKDAESDDEHDKTPMGKRFGNEDWTESGDDDSSTEINLLDTPEAVRVPTVPKKLGKARGKKKSDHVDGKPKTEQKADIVSDEEKWTEEELNEKMYGIARRQLHQYGVRKSHVDNLKLVMSDEYYPALKSVIEWVTKGDGLISAEDVSDAIRGVPMMKEDNVFSTMEHILKKFLVPQKKYPRECEYINLGMQRNLRSKEVTDRSKKLYEKKMRESGEVKGMTIVECGVHVNTEVQMVMEMSK
jgi:hypothetical protein